MSGHSKWSQIKRQKNVTDAAKSRVFARFARSLTVESKKANGIWAAPGLAAVIARAKAANMPKENIERAIAKGTSRDAGALEQVIYEAYGPGGTAIIVGAFTDNKNRTTQEIKHVFAVSGVEIASPGAASWAFTKSPDGSYEPNGPLMDLSNEDGEKLGVVLDALDEHDDIQHVYTNARGYENLGD